MRDVWDGLDDDAADRAVVSYRVFFRQNPRRKYRIRPGIEGELPSVFMSGNPENGWLCIAVRQIMPGFRVRLPFRARTVPNDSEVLARKIFRQLDRAGRSAQ